MRHMTISNIITDFGGIRPFATLLGYPVSTVQNWKKRGRIPQWHFSKIISAGEKAGLQISFEQLIAPKKSRPKRTSN